MATNNNDNRQPAAEEEERLSIDDMLQKYCGEFGPWQLLQFVLTSLAWGLEAFHTMIMIFADKDPKWRCVGSGCSSESSICDMDTNMWEWTESKDVSTVSEFGLICDAKFGVGVVQAFFFVGSMTGAALIGSLSDSNVGRLRTLQSICLYNVVFAAMTACAPSYASYLLLRFYSGFGTGGIGVVAFLLATEAVGPSKRGVAGMSTFYFFSAGIVLLCGSAYVLESWRDLYLMSALLSALYVFAVSFFISESPRWYLVRGRVAEAMEVMHSIAKRNGRHIPTGVTLALDNDQEMADDLPVEGTLKDVFRSPLMRVRLLVAITISFTVSVVYYGLSLNVVNLKTNLYVSVLLNALGEMPAFAITAVLLDRYGRKPLTIGAQWFSSVFCLLGYFVGGVGPWNSVRMVSGILGIFGMAGTYNLLLIYIAELFPTVVRNSALASATQAVQMGAILAPFVVLSGEEFPFVVFAVCGFVGGLLTNYLPETLNRPMYDTISGIHEGETSRELLN